MVFNNTTVATSGSGFIRVREEFDDALNPPAVSPVSGQPQHVSDSYFWNNSENGTHLFKAVLGSENLNNALAENREFYNQQASFNGTVGIGSGPLLNRPATCTPGVAYWAVDAGGNWNRVNTSAQDGALYKCVTANTWQLYYTPYTYPHPLRTSGPLSDNSTLELNATPANQAIYLNWKLETPSTFTGSWHIDYYTTTAKTYTTDISSSAARVATLTENVRNGQWYTVTLNAMLDSAVWLSDTIRIMPTRYQIYLPMITR
jgi:hypothetical protein